MVVVTHKISENVIEILSFEIERSIDSTIIKVVTRYGSESLLETLKKGILTLVQMLMP